jgi:hypothetical protein
LVYELRFENFDSDVVAGADGLIRLEADDEGGRGLGAKFN